MVIALALICFTLLTHITPIIIGWIDDKLIVNIDYTYLYFPISAAVLSTLVANVNWQNTLYINKLVMLLMSLRLLWIIVWIMLFRSCASCYTLWLHWWIWKTGTIITISIDWSIYSAKELWITAHTHIIIHIIIHVIISLLLCKLLSLIKRLRQLLLLLNSLPLILNHFLYGLTLHTPTACVTYWDQVYTIQVTFGLGFTFRMWLMIMMLRF